MFLEREKSNFKRLYNYFEVFLNRKFETSEIKEIGGRKEQKSHHRRD